MNLFCVEEKLCFSNLLMDLNDIGYLIFTGTLNLARYLIVDFQKKCRNYHQNLSFFALFMRFVFIGRLFLFTHCLSKFRSSEKYFPIKNYIYYL